MKKSILRNLLPAGMLIAMDQLIKLVIDKYFMHENFDVVGELFRFSPIINRNLSWGGNFIEILSEPMVVNTLNIVVIFLFLTGYQYYLSLQGRPSPCAKYIYTVGLGGVICSLIDKIFWGGSLDYIQFYQFFVFDLKDCYITTAIVLFIVLIVRYQLNINTREYLEFCFGHSRHN